MIPVLESMRTGWRLVRATPTRSAMIAAAIATPTGLATFASVNEWDGLAGLVWGAAGVATAVVGVAQSSPEPIRASSTRAWGEAGASARAARLPGWVAGVLLAWGALGAGVAGGLTLSRLGNDHPANRDTIIAAAFWAAIVLAVVAAVVRPRVRPRRASATVLTVLQWTMGLPVLVLGAVALAGGIDTDRDASFAIPALMLLVTLAILIVLHPLLRLAGRAVGALPPLRTIETAATTYRSAGLVTGAITLAMLVALTVAILGASVAERGNPYAPLLTDIAALPVVPPHIAVVEPNALPAGPGVEDPGAVAALQLVDSLQREVPSAKVTATTEVSGANVAYGLGTLCSSGPAGACRTLVNDPALASIPGLPIADGALSFLAGGGSLGDIREGWETGAPLPPASWYGLDLLLVPEDALGTGEVSRRSGPIFLTHPRAFSAEDLVRIRAIASSVAGSSGAAVTVITSEDRTGSVGSWRPGEVPWAPTDPRTRWLWTAMAAASALITAVATATIAAHDRKATNRRLELLGATPGEVRGALALHTGLLVGLSTLLAGVATLYLVRFGLDRFNSASPRLAIPFTVPVVPLLVLLVGVPLVAAALAAAVARQRPSYGGH